MAPAILIARLIGPIFVAVGVGILISAPFYQEVITEALHFPTLVYVYGLIAMAAGLAMLNAYRAWTRDWRSIVTVLGWLFLLSGILRLVIPGVMTSVAGTVFANPLALPIDGVVVFVVGGYLSFRAYRG
jgi:hypothetical protein